MSKKCLGCNSSDIEFFMRITDAPKNIQRLITSGKKSLDKKISINLIKCRSCHLIQLENPDLIPENYYKNYLMSTSFSNEFSKYMEDLSEYLVTNYNLKNKAVLEVGCGDGLFSKNLMKNGCKIVGIEPSKKIKKNLNNMKFPILEMYFSTKSNLQKNQFDAIVSRQVFEHLKDPNEYLKAVYKFLKKDGVGLIEVPSFEKAVKLNRYYDIFSDHIAYYTKETLSSIVLRNNFEILEIFDSFNDEYFVIVFEKKTELPFFNFKKSFEKYKQDAIRKIQKLKKEGKIIAVWGAGGKGNALLSFCNLTHNDIKFVIDSDVNKIGKLTIGSHIPITSPKILNSEKIDVIIISAMAFENEIINYLKQVRFKGEIYVISPFLRKSHLA